MTDKFSNTARTLATVIATMTLVGTSLGAIAFVVQDRADLRNLVGRNAEWNARQDIERQTMRREVLEELRLIRASVEKLQLRDR